MLILSTFGLSAHAQADDIKTVHNVVIQAALSGEELRSVLWVQPTRQLLVIRHDRPITVDDMPPLQPSCHE